MEIGVGEKGREGGFVACGVDVAKDSLQVLTLREHLLQGGGSEVEGAYEGAPFCAACWAL